jgi:hypothetical protein
VLLGQTFRTKQPGVGGASGRVGPILDIPILAFTRKARDGRVVVLSFGPHSPAAASRMCGS